MPPLSLSELMRKMMMMFITISARDQRKMMMMMFITITARD